MRVIDSNLENKIWTVHTGLDINPIPADAFISGLLPDGTLKISNISSKAFGGALVACSRPVPSIPGISLPYVGLDWDVFISSSDMSILGRLETDLKVVLQAAGATPIPNVFNFSGQLNYSTGEWQIDVGGNWVDTGFKPVILVSTWTTFRARFFIDIPNNKYSVLSVGVAGSTPFLISPSLQGNICEVSNWGQTAAVQEQTEVMVPGCVSIQKRNINLIWSDQPF